MEVIIYVCAGVVVMLMVSLMMLIDLHFVVLSEECIFLVGVGVFVICLLVLVMLVIVLSTSQSR